MQEYILKDGVLYHHGIKGQKLGNRRWQYENGSLTPEGREHYGYGEARAKYKDAKATYRSGVRKLKNERKTSQNKELNLLNKKAIKNKENYKNNTISKDEYNKKDYNIALNSSKKMDNIDRKYKEEKLKLKAELKKAKQEYKNSEEYKQAKDKAKKVAIAGAVIAGTVLATYGAYKYVESTKDKAFRLTMNNGREATNKIISGASDRMFFRDRKSYDDLWKGAFDYNSTPVANTLNNEVWNTARENSSSFKNARNTLKGYGKKSISELTRQGIKTNSPFFDDDTQKVIDTYLEYLKKGSMGK